MEEDMCGKEHCRNHAVIAVRVMVDDQEIEVCFCLHHYADCKDYVGELEKVLHE